MRTTVGHRAPALAIALTNGLLGLLAWGGAFAAENNASIVEIHRGTVTFDAATNVPGVNVHGKSTALEGRARIRQTADGLVIEHLEAALPVPTLNTGIGLRDEHMRRDVFTTPDGLVPDIRFVAEQITCSGSGRAKTCRLMGDLIIRGTPRRFGITLDVKEDRGSFRATGRGAVRLSTYGIPPPAQLGVRTSDDVAVHVDFVVTPLEDRVAQSTK